MFKPLVLLLSRGLAASCTKGSTVSFNGAAFPWSDAPGWSEWCDSVIAGAATCLTARATAMSAAGCDCGIAASDIGDSGCQQNDSIMFGTASFPWSQATGWREFCDSIIAQQPSCSAALSAALAAGSDCGLTGQVSGGGGGGSATTTQRTTTHTTSYTRTTNASIANPSTAKDPKVFHYFPAWGLWTRDYNAWWLPGGKASGMLYAFFDVNANCECKSTDEGADFNKGASWGGIVNQIHGSNNLQASWDWKGCAGNRAHINAVVQAHPDYEVLMSLGGWTLSSHFHKCLKTAANREKLATEVQVIMSKYGFFSGIDIDWEYPGKYDEQGNERPLTDVHVEVGYWVKFVELLKQKVPQMYHTSAIGMNPELLRKEFATNDFCKLLNHLKYIFTMSYDFYGAWSQTAGHNAPMNDDPENPDLIENFSVVGSMNVLLDLWNSKCRGTYGALESKIVLGLPAYGRTFSKINPSAVHKAGLPGLYTKSSETGEAVYGPGSITDNVGVGYGAIDFWDVKNKYVPNSGVKRYWDPIAETPYLVGERTDKICCLATEHGNNSALCASHDCKRPGPFFISYDDEESIKIKTKYAKSMGFAGVMFWEASGDRTWDLLNAVYEAWGSSIRVPNKYKPVSSIPEFCGPSDEIIPGLEVGTACFMYESWWHNDSCKTIADQWNSKMTQQRHKDKNSCCTDVGMRVGGFGTPDQIKGELRAGRANQYVCPGSIMSSQGSGCVP